MPTQLRMHNMPTQTPMLARGLNALSGCGGAVDVDALGRMLRSHRHSFRIHMHAVFAERTGRACCAWACHLHSLLTPARAVIAEMGGQRREERRAARAPPIPILVGLVTVLSPPFCWTCVFVHVSVLLCFCVVCALHSIVLMSVRVRVLFVCFLFLVRCEFFRLLPHRSGSRLIMH